MTAKHSEFCNFSKADDEKEHEKNILAWKISYTNHITTSLLNCGNRIVILNAISEKK